MKKGPRGEDPGAEVPRRGRGRWGGGGGRGAGGGGEDGTEVRRNMGKGLVLNI